MNARQKAKHFKRLYEEQLPKKPYPVVYPAMLPKHYRIQLLVKTRDLVDLHGESQLLKNCMVNDMLRKIRPLIEENLIVERNIRLDAQLCSLDLWIG